MEDFPKCCISISSSIDVAAIVPSHNMLLPTRLYSRTTLLANNVICMADARSLADKFDAAHSPSSGLTAICTFEPPHSTPISRMMARDASLHSSDTGSNSVDSPSIVDAAQALRHILKTFRCSL